MTSVKYADLDAATIRLCTIKAEAKKYDEQLKTDRSPNDRLGELVKKYGLDDVAAASGLNVSSIKQYLLRAKPLRVSMGRVIKAETVLSKI